MENNQQPIVSESLLVYDIAVIQDGEERKTKEVVGYPVTFPGFEDWNFGVHEEEIYVHGEVFTWWVVSELTTGYRVNDDLESPDQNLIVARTFERLKYMSAEKLSAKIEKLPKLATWPIKF